MLNPTPLLDLLKAEVASIDEINLPIYQKLQRGIIRAVNSGLISTDESLPSERSLASSLGVSRITIRRAITGLAESGILSQRRGAGTFVSKRMEQPLSQLTGFSEDMIRRGMTTTTTWLERSIGPASPHEIQMLNLQPGADVSRLYRVRNADETPLCLEHACLPVAFLPDPTEVTQSLYDFLAQSGKRPVRAIQKIRAELFSIEQAHLLGVPLGSACLYIERQSFLADGTPVEFVCSHYRGDSYDFIAELNL